MFTYIKQSRDSPEQDFQLVTTKPRPGHNEYWRWSHPQLGKNELSITVGLVITYRECWHTDLVS